MYIINQKVTVSDGSVQDLIDALSNRTVLTEQPGFIDLTISIEENEKNVVGVIGRWENKESWYAWEHSPQRQVESNKNKARVVDIQTNYYISQAQVKK